MRTKNLLFVFLIAISTNCFSQEKLPSHIVDVTKATFLNLGISYEKSVGKYQSILGQAFMNTALSISYSGALGNTSSITFDPALSFQYRYYYNYNKRQRKGKRTEMNSLNYLSPTFETIFSKSRISLFHFVEEKRRPINTVGMVWGIQRNYKGRFSLDLNLGLGYLFTTATLPDNTGKTIKENVGNISTLGQLNLGFWLNKRE
jgi:hypothetical protein